MFDIKSIEFFLNLYSKGSISKAAQALFISQQGLSKSIKGLERSLSLPLFRRSQSGIEPTTYAKKLYPYAERLLLDYKAMQNAVSELQQQKTGYINIGCSYGVLNALPIITYMKDFQTNYPAIKTNFFDFPDYVCENMLLDEKVDMAFIVGPIHDNRIKTTSLFKERYCLWVNAENPLSVRSKVTIADILQEPIIFSNRQFKARKLLDSLFDKMHATPNIIYSSVEPITFLYLVYQKAGVAIYPEHWANLVAQLDEVVTVPIDEPEFKWEVFFSVKAGRVSPPNEQLFIKCILEALK